jgi:hypothetical protein
MKTPATATSDKKLPGGKFDPFNNRLSRDIRNTLSESFMTALSRMEPSAYRDEADIWRTKNLSDIYLEYIQIMDFSLSFTITWRECGSRPPVMNARP